MAEEVKPYLCKSLLCDARFDTPEEREEHMREAHPKMFEERVWITRERKCHFSRIPDDAEDTETDEDRSKEGPYSLPLDMISMRCDSKGVSLRPRIRDEVWEFWNEPKWRVVVDYYVDVNERRKSQGYVKLYLITKIAIKLAKKIFEQTESKVFPIVDRTYAGYWQRATGAWSWSMKGVFLSPDSPVSMASMYEVGSQWPMKFLLLKEVKLVKYHHFFWHIDPDEESIKLFKSKLEE